MIYQILKAKLKELHITHDYVHQGTGISESQKGVREVVRCYGNLFACSKCHKEKFVPFTLKELKEHFGGAVEITEAEKRS